MELQTLTVEDWRKSPQKNVRLIKFGGSEIEKTSDGEMRVVISTAARDRDKDTLAPAGWDLANYLKNPVVLWAHDNKKFPIAKAPSTFLSNGKLVSYPIFASKENSEAATAEKMVHGGFINAASVGFNPKTWLFNEDEQGYDFDSQELLEWSFVPVPSNPEALIGAKSAGIDLKPIAAWAEEALDKKIAVYSGLTRSDLERVHQIASGEKTISISRDAILAAINRIKGKAKKPAPDPREIMAERVKRATERVVTKLTGRVF